VHSEHVFKPQDPLWPGHAHYPRSMETLGDDLALLSVMPNGKVQDDRRLAMALAGSELVRLAARGQVDIADGRIVVRHAERTADAELDLALASLLQAGRPPKARVWVSRPRRGIVTSYLARLAASGALRSEGALFGTRWRIADRARVSEAAARLGAIARSAGPVDTASAAFGGLAHAAALDTILYRGLASRGLRARLRQIAEGKVTSAEPSSPAIADAVGGCSFRRHGSSSSSSSKRQQQQAARDQSVDCDRKRLVQALTKPLSRYPACTEFLKEKDAQDRNSTTTGSSWRASGTWCTRHCRGTTSAISRCT